MVDPLLAAGDAGELSVPVELSLGFNLVLGDLGAGGFGCQAIDWLGGQGLIECHEGWAGWDNAHDRGAHFRPRRIPKTGWL